MKLCRKAPHAVSSQDHDFRVVGGALARHLRHIYPFAQVARVKKMALEARQGVVDEAIPHASDVMRSRRGGGSHTRSRSNVLGWLHTNKRGLGIGRGSNDRSETRFWYHTLLDGSPTV